MSLRKRKTAGELTKGGMIKGVIIGGILVTILLSFWVSIPVLIDTFFSGSGPERHEEEIPGFTNHTLDPITPTPPENIPLDNLPQDINLDAFDLEDFLDQDLLSDMFNISDTTMSGDFSDFNVSNFDFPLFSYQHVGGYEYALPSNQQFFKQNCYDTILPDGSEWEKSANIAWKTILTSANKVDSSFDTYSTEISMQLTSISNITMILPSYPYIPKLVDDSFKLNDSGGYIDQDTEIKIDKGKALYLSSPGNPAGTNGELTYNIMCDNSMDDGVVTWLKLAGTMAQIQGNIPPSVNNYLAVPGSFHSNSTHPEFNRTVSEINATYNLDPGTQSSHDMMNSIMIYLKDNYDLFNSFPERPDEGENMIEWFLTRTHSLSTPNDQPQYINAGGTPYDFAAAATMLGRAFGVPTRLATGFIDWDNDQEITMANVHAWCEVYLPTSSTEGVFVNYDILEYHTSFTFDNSSWEDFQEDTYYNMSFINITAPQNGEIINEINLSHDLSINFSLYTVLNRSDNYYHFELYNPINGTIITNMTNISFFNLSRVITIAAGGVIDNTVRVGADLDTTNGTKRLWSDWVNFTVSNQPAINIINPLDGAIFNSPIVPLEFSSYPLYDGWATLQWWLNINGTYNGSYRVNITTDTNFQFNVGADGNFTIQANMSYNNGTDFLSNVVDFQVRSENGTIDLQAPTGNYTGGNQFPLVYELVNMSGAIQNVGYFITNGTWNYTNSSLPTSTIFYGLTDPMPVNLTASVDYNLTVICNTSVGVVQNTTTFTVNPEEDIWINEPWEEQRFDFQSNISLNLTYLNYSAVTSITYVLDGGAPIAVGITGSPIITTIPGPLSNGNHTIQAFMEVNAQNFSSNIVTFNVSAELGSVTSEPLPLNGSTYSTNVIDVGYVVTGNTSRIINVTAEVYHWYGAYYNTYYLSDQTTFSGTFFLGLSDYDNYYVIINVTTQWGIFNSFTSVGNVSFTYSPGEYLTILNPSNGMTLYNHTIPLIFIYNNATTIDHFKYFLNGAPSSNIYSNTSFTVPANGNYTIFMRGYYANASIWKESATISFEVIQEEGNVDVTLPVNGTTLSAAGINANNSLINVVYTNTTPIIPGDLYCIVSGPAFRNVTINPLSPNSSLLDPSFLPNGNYTIQAYMRTIASYPSYLMSPLINFNVDYENGTIAIVQPTSPQLSRANIPLAVNINTLASIISREFRWTGPSSSGIPWTSTTFPTTFTVSYNGAHTVYVRVRTTRGWLNTSRAFNVNQTLVIDAYANGVPVLTGAVLDTSSITLMVHAHDTTPIDTPNVQVNFTDITQGMFLGSGVTNSSGGASIVLSSATLQTMWTGVHKIQVSTNTSLVNYTYFAINRALSVGITSLTPANGSEHYIVRNGPSTYGTVFTLQGWVHNSSGAPIPNAWVQANIDGGTNCANLLPVIRNVLTNASGDFTWSGRIDSTVDEDLHSLSGNFIGILHRDGYNFTGFTTLFASIGANITVNTSITVDFNPKTVEVFTNINITGTLTFDNGTAFAGQNINITVEIWDGGFLNYTTSYIVSTNAFGDFEQLHYIDQFQSGDTIKIYANFYSPTPIYLDSTAYQEG